MMHKKQGINGNVMLPPLQSQTAKANLGNEIEGRVEMSGKNALVKQADLTRLFKAANAAGLKIAEAHFAKDGSVKLTMGNAEQSYSTEPETNDWAGVGAK